VAPNVIILMACRFIVGLGVGAAFVPVDMLAEACPEKARGRFGFWLFFKRTRRVHAFRFSSPPSPHTSMCFHPGLGLIVESLVESTPCLKVRTTRTQIANLSFSVGVVAITLLGSIVLEPGGWRLLALVGLALFTLFCRQNTS
jgi:MFS family permease